MLRLPPPRLFISFCSSVCLAFAGCGGNPPERPATDLSRLAPVEYGKPIFFGRGGEGDRLKMTGWAVTEPFFTWTDGIAASLAVRLPPTEEVVQLHFRMCGMNMPKRLPYQRVDLYLNAEKIVRWQVSNETVFTVAVPEKLASQPDPLLIIDFYTPNATAPVSIGAGGDPRRLGLRLSEMTVTKTPREAGVGANGRG